MKLRQPLRRFHIWLGWLVGVPLLIWTASGLFMAAQPIERVRGEHLVREAPRLSLSAPPVPPAIGPRPVKSLTLEQQPGGARWLIRYADGGARRADPATGGLLPPLSAIEAAAIVRGRYKGDSDIVAIDRTSAEAPPLDLRREADTYRVAFRDGARFYVDAATGEILARRTGLWRVYDFMWGLHIMDLQTREDINNLWLVVFGLLAVLSILMALVLLPISVWKRR
jgi:hypothetical protein